MENSRREEIYLILNEFGDTTPIYEVMNKFCEDNKMLPIAIGEYADYYVQYAQDNMAKEFLIEIMNELQKLQIIPEFATAKERKAKIDNNYELEINIAKIIEDKAIGYHFLNPFVTEISSLIRQRIEGAGTRISNKAVGTMLMVCKEKFGGDFNTKHSADYRKAIADEYAKENPTVVEDKKTV